MYKNICLFIFYFSCSFTIFANVDSDSLRFKVDSLQQELTMYHHKVDSLLKSIHPDKFTARFSLHNYDDVAVYYKAAKCTKEYCVETCDAPPFELSCGSKANVLNIHELTFTMDSCCIYNVQIQSNLCLFKVNDTICIKNRDTLTKIDRNGYYIYLFDMLNIEIMRPLTEKKYISLSPTRPVVSLK